MMVLFAYCLATVIAGWGASVLLNVVLPSWDIEVGVLLFAVGFWWAHLFGSVWGWLRWQLDGRPTDGGSVKIVPGFSKGTFYVLSRCIKDDFTVHGPFTYVTSRMRTHRLEEHPDWSIS